MFTNDQYVAMLEKRAADESEEKDSASTALKEYNANRGDSRRYLGSLFAKADQVEDQMTSDTRKVLDHRDESGSPFIKVARAAFDAGYVHTKLANTSDTYREVAFRSFMSELEKLAALKPQTMAQLAVKNRVAAAAPKVWDLSSSVASGARAALPSGSGTTVNQPGLLARAAKAIGFGG
jgi:hypothetical protein